MTPKLIIIVGPTAIGKTALSIELAKHFNCDIISSDSRQFYKEMTIGTAVPNEDELNAARHHFIQQKSVLEDYSVGNFERDAIKKIAELHKVSPYVIMVGGSGLYIKAITDGLDDFPHVEKSIRLKLNSQLEQDGLISLQKQLKALDRKTYDSIAIDNPQRVIRALEICLGTGRPYSDFLSKSKKIRPFETFLIGLTTDRSTLYNRINLRVDTMMAQGLLEEVKALMPYKNLNALNTVGYKELFRYLDNEISLEMAISEIKKHTRRFAKRQLTWFKKNETIKWFDYRTETNKIIRYIESKKKSSY